MFNYQVNSKIYHVYNYLNALHITIFLLDSFFYFKIQFDDLYKCFYNNCFSDVLKEETVCSSPPFFPCITPSHTSATIYYQHSAVSSKPLCTDSSKNMLRAAIHTEVNENKVKVYQLLFYSLTTVFHCFSFKNVLNICEEYLPEEAIFL